MSISYWWDAVAIQPESKVVILHFLAVRPKREQALEFAQAFDVAPACAEIDASDLSNIVNYDPRTLGAKAGIEIFRGAEKDVLLLKSGDKLTGTVQNGSFRIQASYAQLEFPAPDIATIIYEGGANNIERIVVLSETDEIGVEELPWEISNLVSYKEGIRESSGAAEFHQAVEEHKRKLIIEALKKTNGNQTKAAELLGLQRTYLVRLIKTLGIKQ